MLPPRWLVVVWFLPAAVHAVMVNADGVETMQMAVTTHVMQLLHLWASDLAFHGAIAVVVAVGAVIFILPLFCSLLFR